MGLYRVAYYQTERGSEPVFEFIKKQDKATRSKLNRFVGLLENSGPDLGMPYARYLKGGLYELRIRGKNEVRIFYIVQLADNIIFFLHAFKKRSQKLPQQELDLARQHQKELTEL